MLYYEYCNCSEIARPREHTAQRAFLFNQLKWPCHNMSYYRGKKSFQRGGSRRAGPRRAKFKDTVIDYRKFVCKATVTEEISAYVPTHEFSDFTIALKLKANIKSRGYLVPTPIQDAVIPQALLGKDVVGIANTGTGKTAAFLIPLINKVLQDYRQRVLIITPTRELALQIQQEIRNFTHGMRINSALLIGGIGIRAQFMALRARPAFVIGTPGRIKDLVNRKGLLLFDFKTLVLDEVDRMLDMGFISSVREFSKGLPKQRQTLFFSATLSSNIEKLLGEFVVNPVKISVKQQETPKNVDQDVVHVGNKNKLEVLTGLLKQAAFRKVLIFGRTKYGVEHLAKSLAEKGFKASSIHGDKNQAQRIRSLAKFKSNEVNILVATDVAARGLDIPNVNHVINFEIPATYQDYIHRIGRTGRANSAGKALTFI